jgi:hypothetical protein
MDSNIHQWLLSGDPAVRWQVLRDLVKDDRYAREREKVATEGWGKRLLDLQDKDGRWAGGFYTPKWTSTHYTLLLLKRLGLPPDNEKAGKACDVLLNTGFRPNGGISYWAHYPNGETCIDGMSLAIFSYFHRQDKRLSRMAENILGAQMADGGWNCRYPRGATHASFNTTISVLEGLSEYTKMNTDFAMDIEKARRRAHEFLLHHRLFKSHRTGRIANSTITRFTFPQHWHYHVYSALDYFVQINHGYDLRFEDAIELVKSKSRNGLWHVGSPHSGKVWFVLEETGKPSRLMTLFCMRILTWWAQVQTSE